MTTKSRTAVQLVVLLACTALGAGLVQAIAMAHAALT
jgi:hypothetical protein